MLYIVQIESGPRGSMSLLEQLVLSIQIALGKQNLSQIYNVLDIYTNSLRIPPSPPPREKHQFVVHVDICDSSNPAYSTFHHTDVTSRPLTSGTSKAVFDPNKWRAYQISTANGVSHHKCIDHKWMLLVWLLAPIPILNSWTFTFLARRYGAENVLSRCMMEI